MAARFRIDDRLGTYEAVAALAPEHAETLAAIRGAVAGIHPDALESASVRERSVSWGFGAAKKVWYAYAMPHSAHVNLGFFQGIHLPDPEGLLTGTGKVLRHVKLTGAADVRTPAILALLAAAHDERAQALNPTGGS